MAPHNERSATFPARVERLGTPQTETSSTRRAVERFKGVTRQNGRRSAAEGARFPKGTFSDGSKHCFGRGTQVGRPTSRKRGSRVRSAGKFVASTPGERFDVIAEVSPLGTSTAPPASLLVRPMGSRRCCRLPFRRSRARRCVYADHGVRERTPSLGWLHSYLLR